MRHSFSQARYLYILRLKVPRLPEFPIEDNLQSIAL
jgi:hypothetical protein